MSLSTPASSQRPSRPASRWPRLWGPSLALLLAFLALRAGAEQWRELSLWRGLAEQAAGLHGGDERVRTVPRQCGGGGGDSA